MTTKEAQKLNKLEREVKVLKSFMLNLVPYDNEGKYKDSFLKQIGIASKSVDVFEYNGKDSLLKRLT